MLCHSQCYFFWFIKYSHCT